MAAPSEPDALGAQVLEALPCAALVVDGAYRVVLANAAARAALAVAPGASLPEALGCHDPSGGSCGTEARCAACAIRDAARAALAGERAMGRGFVLRAGEDGTPPDLHLLAFAGPLAAAGGAPRAILVLADANAILADPRIVRICAGCGRVQDEEHAWHPLHHYLEDALGLEGGEVLCDECARRAGPAGEP